jgi:hypothetical protein
VATLPPELTAPPWEALPPVDAPPVVFDEQPKTSVTATNAGNLAIAVCGLCREYLFIIVASVGRAQ